MSQTFRDRPSSILNKGHLSLNPFPIGGDANVVRADPATEHYLALWKEYDAIPSYELTGVIELQQRIDSSALESALRDVIEHNPMLRARFTMDDHKWLFTFGRNHRIDFSDVTLGSINELKSFSEYIHNKPFVPFDGSALLLVRFVNVIDSSYLIIKISHLIADASAFMPLIIKLTAALSGNNSSPSYPISLPTFIQSEDDLNDDGEIMEKLSWWKMHLQSHRYFTGCPPKVVTGHSVHYRRHLNSETGAMLRRYSAEHRVPLSTIFFHAYLKSIAAIDNDNDVLVSMVVANRPPSLRAYIACFADWMLVRPWSTNESRNDSLASLRAGLKHSKAHYIPFWYLMKQLGQGFYNHPCGLSPYQFNFVPPSVADAAKSNGVMRWMDEIELPARMPFFEMMCRVFPRLNDEYLIELNAHSGLVDAARANAMMSLIFANLDHFTADLASTRQI